MAPKKKSMLSTLAFLLILGGIMMGSFTVLRMLFIALQNHVYYTDFAQFGTAIDLLGLLGSLLMNGVVGWKLAPPVRGFVNKELKI